MTSAIARTCTIGVSRGSPSRNAATGASAAANPPISTPETSVSVAPVGATFDHCSGRWTSATPIPKSRTKSNIVMTSRASANRPKSAGPSSRASTTVMISVVDLLSAKTT
jgi:hypothetical protein